jgi:hypothetical protein
MSLIKITNSINICREYEDSRIIIKRGLWAYGESNYINEPRIYIDEVTIRNLGLLLLYYVFNEANIDNITIYLKSKYSSIKMIIIDKPSVSSNINLDFCSSYISKVSNYRYKKKHYLKKYEILRNYENNKTDALVLNLSNESNDYNMPLDRLLISGSEDAYIFIADTFLNLSLNESKVSDITFCPISSDLVSAGIESDYFSIFLSRSELYFTAYLAN